MSDKMDLYDMKMIWWNWFCCSPQYWGHGLTLKKLKKLKNSIFNDSGIWWDLFDRHCYGESLPWLVDKDENYDHAISNFSGMITKKAFLHKLIN